VTRTRIFVGVAAILGAAVGLFYATTFDLLSMCPGVPGPCPGVHDEIFGWQPGFLAVPIWTVIGLVGGALVGWVAAGPLTRIRWLVIGVATVVGVVAYFAWVYTPDPGFDL
jgi:ABC-type branched-subunit amino acid transport system permease subunit